jgi:hypothetical protein
MEGMGIGQSGVGGGQGLMGTGIHAYDMHTWAWEAYSAIGFGG